MASAIIRAVRTISGNQPAIRRIIEGATETFNAGVPVFVAVADGGVEESLTLDDNGAGDNIKAIAGFSKEPGANLAATGVAETLTFGSVQNQAAAVNIPRGAPINDGRVGFEVANPDSVFRGQVGPAQSAVATLVGTDLGLSRDTDGSWFVDTTATGANQIAVTVVAIDADDARGVQFTVLPAAMQVAA